jgi:hypothetical protein
MAADIYQLTIIAGKRNPQISSHLIILNVGKILGSFKKASCCIYQTIVLLIKQLRCFCLAILHKA